MYKKSVSGAGSIGLTGGAPTLVGIRWLTIKTEAVGKKKYFESFSLRTCCALSIEYELAMPTCTVITAEYGPYGNLNPRTMYNNECTYDCAKNTLIWTFSKTFISFFQNFDCGATVCYHCTIQTDIMDNAQTSHFI